MLPQYDLQLARFPKQAVVLTEPQIIQQLTLWLNSGMNHTPTHTDTHAIHTDSVVSKHSSWQGRVRKWQMEISNGWWLSSFISALLSWNAKCSAGPMHWHIFCSLADAECIARFGYWMKGLKMKQNNRATLAQSISYSSGIVWNTEIQRWKTDSQKTGAITKHINHKRAWQTWLLCPPNTKNKPRIKREQ